MPAYAYPHYDAVRPPELDGETVLHDVAIVGGGPVGLSLALDLAQRGVRTVVLQSSNTLSEGSRALCWSKRTLEILDRFGVAQPIAARGFTWSTGRVFAGDREVYHFDLQPERDQPFPAFVNLQQYFAEEYLVDAVRGANELIELRWQNKATGIEQDDEAVTLKVETPHGFYQLQSRYVVACDGAKSTIRRAMGLGFEGRVFEDNFLIADVDVAGDVGAKDRRFWFNPSFDPSETALCHGQGDGMWRVDFQLGWDVDVEAEMQPEKALPRIKALLGRDDVEATWISIYTFQCRRIERFRHDRVLFAGDAAHQVSPFGARGGNSGIQDADNLAWKLALVLDGRAPDALLDSYHDERAYAADENIRVTSRTVDFMTAKTPLRARMRQAVLGLAEKHDFARALINSGRLSTPTVHDGSPLNSDHGIAGPAAIGGPCPNRQLADGGYLLDNLGRGLRFEGLYVADGAPSSTQLSAFKALQAADVPLDTIVVGVEDAEGLRTLPDPDGRIAATLGAGPGQYILLRPDQHVAAVLPRLDLAQLHSALDRAMAKPASPVLAQAGE